MLVTLVGSFGTVCGLLAYLLMAHGRWSSMSVRYATVNALGGLASTIATISYHAWPSVVSNAAWTAIAAVSLVRMLGERRRSALADVTPIGTTERLLEVAAA